MPQVSVDDVAETTLGDLTPTEDTALDGIRHTVQVIAFNRNSADVADQDGPASAPRTATPKPAQVIVGADGDGSRRPGEAHGDVGRGKGGHQL